MPRPLFHFFYNRFAVFYAPMENGPAENPSRSLPHFWPWLAVLLILLLAGFVRFRLLDIPFERDEGEYAYAGQLLLQGIPPYELAYNMKLPGTYFAYALGMAIFGQTIAGVHATLLVANALTIIFLFLLVRKLFGTVAGVMASATFAILSVSPVVLGMAAHANHFVILFAVPATLLLWKAEESNRLGALCASGFFYGLAFLMKQQGICFCIFAAIVVAGNAFRNKTFLSAGFAKKIFCLGLPMLAPFLLTCLYLKWAGVFSRFWFWTFKYAGSYATEVTLHDGITKFWQYVEKTWPIYLVFLALVASGLPFIAQNRALRKQIVFAVLFFAFSFLGTAIDLNFREHYFILSLPAFAMMAGLSVILLQAAMGNNAGKMIPSAFCALALGFSIYQQRQFFFQLPADAISRVIYSQSVPFADMPALANYIRANSSANSTVGVVGSEPEIYFYAQRHSATGYIYVYPLMEVQPFASQMQREMAGEIETNQPEYLVFVHDPESWIIHESSDRYIFQWFTQYVNADYNKVAVIVKLAWPKTVFLEGADARDARIMGTNVDYVAVFKRKAPGP